jgi:putative iron-regulated protein
MKMLFELKKVFCGLFVIGFISGCQTVGGESSSSASNNSSLTNPLLLAYADQANVVYERTLEDAKKMQGVINQFAANPTQDTLNLAQSSWLNARESYGVSEIFRLSNGPIDAEEGWVANAYGAPEGQLNAWPLDENMIDYTTDASGRKTTGNIIDNTGVFNPGGNASEPVDVTQITADALALLNENGGDANVATGYHAIEFLLWGQDQDYADFSQDSVTRGALVAGQRPITDFTTDQHAQRRLQYLQAATELLVSDLEMVANAWKLELQGSDCAANANGCYRAALLGQLTGADAGLNIPQNTALRQIVSGMGVFIKSELANERIAVAVLTPSEEDEHSCFSDNTHRDISLNYQGFVNVLKGSVDGQSFGQSFYQSASSDTQLKLSGLIKKVDARINQMNDLAENKWHFDYQILPGNNDMNIRRMKNDMRKLGDMMVVVASDIGVDLSTDDVTDPEETQL